MASIPFRGLQPLVGRDERLDNSAEFRRNGLDPLQGIGTRLRTCHRRCRSSRYRRDAHLSASGSRSPTSGAQCWTGPGSPRAARQCVLPVVPLCGPSARRCLGVRPEPAHAGLCVGSGESGPHTGTDGIFLSPDCKQRAEHVARTRARAQSLRQRSTPSRPLALTGRRVQARLTSPGATVVLRLRWGDTSVTIGTRLLPSPSG